MSFRKSRVASAAFLTRFSYIYSGETKLRIFDRICHCKIDSSGPLSLLICLLSRYFFYFHGEPINNYTSCGTVAFYGPFFFFFFFADHRATVFTLSKTFETAQKKSCAAFLPIFVMKSGARTIKHIYFVSLDIYLHSSILTYLLIHFQFIIITNISFVTNPAYFVRHLASPVVLTK